MSEKTIPLSRRYEVPGEPPFESIVLREPTYHDIFMSGLGRPVEWQPSKTGDFVRIVYPEVIDAYVVRLLKAPAYGAVAGLEAADALLLAEEICGFFRLKPESRKPATGSSSG